MLIMHSQTPQAESAVQSARAMSLLGYYYYRTSVLEANWTLAHGLLRASCELGEAEVRLQSIVLVTLTNDSWNDGLGAGMHQCGSDGAQRAWSTIRLGGSGIKVV